MKHTTHTAFDRKGNAVPVFIPVADPKPSTLNTMQLIHFIAKCREFTTIVIKQHDDMTPLEAVAFLSSKSHGHTWMIKVAGGPGTLYAYEAKSI